MIVEPASMSFMRWRELAFSGYTLLRSLEYERLRGAVLSGRTLDIGGGSRFTYLDLFKVEGEVETINISDKVGATWLADLNQPLKFESGSFDTVISLNTLEHIREDQQLLGEMVRVLKPGGRMIFTVPFLYRVHGSPHDYHRHTSQWWQAALESLGLEDDSFSIEPLVWGRLSAGLAQFPWFRAGIFGGTLKKIVLLAELVAKQAANRGEYALGYHVTARKGVVQRQNITT